MNFAFYRRQRPVAQTSLLVRFASGGVSSWKHLKPCRFVEISQEFSKALVEKRLIKRELWAENLYICRNLASATRRSQYSKRPNSRLFQVDTVDFNFLAKYNVAHVLEKCYTLMELKDLI